MNPQLSVVIPTYKRTDSLERLLDRLASQVGVELDIIVVDQNGPSFFAGSLLQKLGRINHLQSIAPNASLARNVGFLQAKFSHVLFIDDDLVPEPDFCWKGLQIFAGHPLIKCFVPLVFPEGGRAEWINFMRNKRIAYYPGDNNIFAISDSISAAVFFEKEYFKLSGGFDIYLFDFAKAAEDKELFLRMLKKDMTLWYVPYVEIFHDEGIDGGCEMRTVGYWATRKKNLRAMAFHNRVHSVTPGILSIKSIFNIARSAFLNKKAISSGISNLLREVSLMRQSIKESKQYFEQYKEKYSKPFAGFIKKT